MSGKSKTAFVKCAALIAPLALLLSGCSYDYLQHTDRVAYSAGDAVKANLESETINPSADSQYDVSGLGEDGQVVGPETEEAAAP